MLSEISLDSLWSQFIAVVLLLAPIVLPLIRYILHLGSVQAWIKKQQYGDMILMLAELAIDKVEAVANAAKKDGQATPPTSAQKLADAMAFIREQGKSMSLPNSMLNSAMLKAAIESKLAEKNAAS
jgi:hypothetical protein